MMDTSESQADEAIKYTAHWFYSPAEKDSWYPFSLSDNTRLESAFRSGSQYADVFGCRYQADLLASTVKPVYWESDVAPEIRRSWWYSAPSSNVEEWIPLNQWNCEMLETAYSNACSLKAWPVSVNLTGVGQVVMENAVSLKIHHVDESGQLRDLTAQEEALKSDYAMMGGLSAGTPLKREFGADFYASLPPNEPDTFNHLVLVVHGIGGVCDLRFRTLPECVNDLRQLAGRFSQGYHQNASPNGSLKNSGAAASSTAENGAAIEFLPIQWHSALHNGPEGLNEKLNRISLEACGKIRSFVNETLLDVLLFTSPVYHQAIIENVVSELNRVYTLFRTRHPGFDGRVSLAGHSLGSVIVFDILANQAASLNSAPLLLGPYHVHNETVKLLFEPFIFFAIGSPLAMFLTVAGVNSIPANYSLPTCKYLYNIFHPFDPVSYRVEPLVQQTEMNSPPPPFVMPHHRGRKRLHLEVKDVVTKIGDDIRRRVVGSIQSMTVFFKRTRAFSSGSAGLLVDQIGDLSTSASVDEIVAAASTAEEPSTLQQSQPQFPPSSSIIYNYGDLNAGKRIDYVLQEGPIEVVNPYLFSIASHLCYWQSEDTCLFIVRALCKSTSPS